MNKSKTRSIIVLILVLAIALFAGVSVALFNSTTKVSAKTFVESQEENYNFTLITNEDGEASYKIALKPALRNTIELVVIPVATSKYLSVRKLPDPL